MKLALHACCGPCLIEPYDALASDAEDVVVVYFNPNIHPTAEYHRRFETLVAYAEEQGIDVVELPYEADKWVAAVAPFAADKSRRCHACYRLRLGQVARWAAENGFDSISTTLTVSPYQDAEAIAEEGRAAAAAAEVEFVERDFRDRYPDATRRSREAGMYRQNYCGCQFSELEARQEREARKAARKAAKADGSERS